MSINAISTVAILVHGFNVTAPAWTVGKFRKPFEALGCLVEEFNYGYWPYPWQLTKRNPKFAKQLAERCRYWKSQNYRVVVVGHSNGAAIVRLACTIHSARMDRVLAVQPALRQESSVCDQVDRVLVVHNDGDRTVVLGRLLGRITKLVRMDSWRFRPWGKMGRYGYVGTRQNHINIDTDSDIYPEEVRARGHSTLFKENLASYWLPYLADLVVNK